MKPCDAVVVWVIADKSRRPPLAKLKMPVLVRFKTDVPPLEADNKSVEVESRLSFAVPVDVPIPTRSEGLVSLTIAPSSVQPEIFKSDALAE